MGLLDPCLFDRRFALFSLSRSDEAIPRHVLELETYLLQQFYLLSLSLTYSSVSEIDGHRRLLEQRHRSDQVARAEQIADAFRPACSPLRASMGFGAGQNVTP